MLKHIVALATLTLMFFVAGCGRSGDTPTVPQAQPAAASDIDIGDHVVHYNAQTTDLLSPQVARAIDVVRSKNRAMVTVSVLDKSTGESVPAEFTVRTVNLAGKSTGESVPAEFTVRTVNLAGQLKNVTMKRVPEQEAIYYVGTTGIANRETLTFNISITPEGATKASDVSFTREFFSN
jgi:hypothetical protein